MYSKPEVIEEIRYVHTSFELVFRFENNITLLMGDSGLGKTVVFSVLKEASVDNKILLYFNYLDMNRDILQEIEKAKGKLIVLDNADILLTSEIRKWIALDTENQYLIIGRNPADLLITTDNIYILGQSRKGEMVRFTLEKLWKGSDNDGNKDGGMGRICRI